MTTAEELGELERRLARRERSTFARTVIAMAIPVTTAALILWVMASRIEERSQELEKLQARADDAVAAMAAASEVADQREHEASTAEKRAKKAEAELRALERRLQEAARFDRHLRPIDWGNAKTVASHAPGAGPLLREISKLERAGVGWSHANRRSEGFTSPGFAGHVLQQLGRVPAGDPAKALDALAVTQDRPRTGDVILYDGGYAMFYLEDPRGTPFVVGMTPLGITSLEPDFGPKRRGVVHVR